jgi:branched-chain amino acid aminotransferase
MTVETKSKAAAKKVTVHPNTWVYHDGEYGRYHDIKLGLMTHALHYGTGVFEGIRAYWNVKKEQLFLLEGPAHFDRMRRSANVMRFTLPHSTEELVNITLEVLRRNQFKSDVYIRPLLFTSSEEIGVRLHNIEQSFLIYAIPFGNYVGDCAHGGRPCVGGLGREPVHDQRRNRLHTSGYRRHPRRHHKDVDHRSHQRRAGSTRG